MSLPRLCAAAVAASLFALWPARASAFCRTITDPTPADWPQTQQCYDYPTAIPLWWSNACVGFSVQENASTQIALADARTHAQAAFDTWSAAACPGGGSPSIKAVDEGPVACATVEYSEAGPNQHVIVFRDASWPYNNQYNTLALTTVTFDTDTGEIYDADMEINSAGKSIVLSASPPAGSYDFDAIVTHEAGHFLGLAHSPIDTAVMYAFYKPGSPTLTSDDVGGICAIYAADGTRSADVDAGNKMVTPETIKEGTCDPTPRHGFGSACGPVGPVVRTVTKGTCSVAGGPGAGTGGGGDLEGIALAGVAALLALGLRRARLRAMRQQRFLPLAFASVLGLGAAASFTLQTEREAQASVSISVLFDELVRDSDGAVMVTPTEQRSVWENGRIMTYTRLHVDRPIAGKIDDEPWVRTLGGVVGKLGQLVEGEAVFTVGRPGLLFLQRSSAGFYEVTARAQGQFPVVLDEAQAPRFTRAAGVGALVPTPDDRVSKIARLRAAAGIPAGAPLASDVLHKRPVEEGLRDVAAAWARLHGPK